MVDEARPWESASAWLADTVRHGGSGGRLFDVRQRGDGAWDVVLLLDGGYGSREDAEGSLRVEVDNLRRAYVAEAEAGRIAPADDRYLTQIGLERTEAPPGPPNPESAQGGSA